MDRLVPGIYRHHKGSLYFVLGAAKHSETEEIHVVYVPLEPCGEHRDLAPMLFVRPGFGPNGFFEAVGQGVERFTLICPVDFSSFMQGTWRR